MGTSIPSTIFAAGGRRPASTSVPCSARKLKIGASYEPARRLQSRKSSMSVFVRARSLNGRAPADYCEPSKFEPSSQFNAAAIALCAAAHRSSDAELRNLPGQAIEHRLTGRRCRGQRGLLMGFRAPAVPGMPMASQGRSAGLRGPIPCARRQRRERRRARSRCSGAARPSLAFFIVD
jgi:hypothetical protein